jgi:hypothetical protein
MTCFGSSIAAFGLIALIAMPSAALAKKKAEAQAPCKEPAKVSLEPGMKVISHLAGPNWSVGKVTAVKGKTIEVEDARGGLGSTSASEIALYPGTLYRDHTPPCFQAGDRVLARSKGNTWREAQVIDANPGKVTFQFLDSQTGSAGPLDLVRMPKK